MEQSAVGFDHGLPCRVKKWPEGLSRVLPLLRPEGHVFHTAWETMIKFYYSTLADLFSSLFIHIKMNFNALKWAIFGSLHGC